VSLTLVSALVRLPRSAETPERRIGLLAPLFAAGIPLVLYVDGFSFERLADVDVPPWVHLRPLDPERTETARRIVALPRPPALPAGANPEKDTPEFFALMLAKSELVADAVRAGLVQTRTTGFIDAGIAKVFRDPEASLARIRDADLGRLRNVLAPGIHPVRPRSPEELLDQVDWTFCGGLLLLPSWRAAEFEAAVHGALAEFLALGRLTWEVNAWALLAGRDPDLFTWFPADHDDRMSMIPPIPG